MSRLCVATEDGRAYYAMANKLKGAGFSFESVLPRDVGREFDLVFTTRREGYRFGSKAVFDDELDSYPGLVRGFVISRLAGGRGDLLVGVDPGSRMGLAAFYGEERLLSVTFTEAAPLVELVCRLVDTVESPRAVVRVGDGGGARSTALVAELSARVQKAAVEVVDEKGTSGAGGSLGMKRDQGAAAKIALRKGVLYRQSG
jgi:hypothetical protein